MTVYVTTFLFAIGSALFPLLNVEAFIAGASAINATTGVWLISFVAGLGQAIGKVFWYEVGRSSMNWSYIKKKMDAPGWRDRYEAVRDRVENRPLTGFAFLMLSSVVGLPPLAITAVLAGQLRFNRVWFFVTIAVGRTLRFVLVLESVDLIGQLGIFH